MGITIYHILDSSSARLFVWFFTKSLEEMSKSPAFSNKKAV